MKKTFPNLFLALLLGPSCLLADVGTLKFIESPQSDLNGIKEIQIQPEVPPRAYQIGASFQKSSPLVVYGTMKGSATSQAGLKQGDLILAVNGIKVSRLDDLQAIVSAAGAQQLKLSVKREGKEMRIKVTPREVRQPEAAMELPNPFVPRHQVAEDARSEFKPLGKDRVHLELRTLEPEKADSGSAKTNQLLTEILGELKEMNSRQKRILSPIQPGSQWPQAKPYRQLPSQGAAKPMPQQPSQGATKEGSTGSSSSRTRSRRVVLPPTAKPKVAPQPDNNPQSEGSSLLVPAQPLPDEARKALVEALKKANALKEPKAGPPAEKPRKDPTEE